MTNAASGQKRSWDGQDGEASKRLKDRQETKDWRDRPPRQESADRRNSTHENGERRRLESGRRRRRDGDRKQWDRDDQNTDRRSGGRRRSRSRSRSRRSVSRSPSRSAPFDEEREEGEISPKDAPQQQAGNSTADKPNVPPAEEESVDLEMPVSPPPLEDVLAARRARRAEILAKYANATASPSPAPAHEVHPISDSIHEVAVDTPGVDGRRESPSLSPSPSNFALAKNGDDDSQTRVENGPEQVSAADYDPSLDRREDEHKRFGDNAIAVDGGDEEEVEEVEEEEDAEDDLDDMFAVTAPVKKVKKVKKKRPMAVPALITTTLDSAADSEGYYSVILGEQLDGGRYQVFSSLGKGMFANVVRARILQGEPQEVGREVAIKIIRCQESMYRAGLKEVQILNKLKQVDPEDKKHIVRLERTFEHRGHLCIVFESLSMNLREVVKRFGKDVGLNIRAVRAYAHQLFLALSLLRKANIMHADIKPDNILVNEQKTVLKLCDLGSASDASENDITPYLVSRFYRAPEIILGIPYDPSLDIWSTGCTLYELYTGKILFPGRSNNHMLLLMMELKGRFNSKMLKKAKFGDVYFDDMGGFESVEKDRITGNDVIRKVHISKASRDLKARLMPPPSVRSSEEESRLIVAFIDLLDKCLALDPARRITPKEALAHPFIRG